MRIATLQTARQTFDAIQQRQAEQAKLQGQLSSGLRVRSPGDDPVAAAQAERARSRLAQLAQDKRATELSTSLLATADGALAQGVSLMQSTREWLVAAGDGAYNAQDRQSLAQQLVSARAQLLQLANTSDGAGGYVFSAQGSAGAPFSGSATPAFGPAAGEQRIGEQGRYAASVDGQACFVNVAQGNGVFVTASAAANTGSGWIDTGTVADATALTGHAYQITFGGTPAAPTYSVTDSTAGTPLASNVAYTPGAPIAFDGQRVSVSGSPAAGDRFDVNPAQHQSVFQTLDDAIALLKDPSVTQPQYAERLARVQAGVDRALDAMVFARSRVGEEQHLVEGSAAVADQSTLAAEQHRSSLRDMDIAQGVADLQTSQATMEAALRSYTGVARSSLFDYMR